MIKRSLKAPSKSFFLFGPRATGKSTWLRQNFSDAYFIDLLKSSDYLSLQKDPSLLAKRVYGSKMKWIVIDEIQRLPELLNEVHAMIFDSNKELMFALTGSSARKLRKMEANMLAGRALTKSFFSINSLELNFNFDLESILSLGMLPEIFNLETDNERCEYLLSYVETYLEQEIKQEALVRQLSTFHRFLSVAATLNGQQLNLSNIARETGVARSTVQGYFSILQDTLLGYVLEAYRANIKVKEVSSPKFYFFDTGVLRAINDKIYDPIESMERGYLLETFLLKEINSFLSYQNIGGKIYYWRTPSGTEIDFFWKKGKSCVGIEVKSSTKWKEEYNKGLRVGLKSSMISKAYGVYRGTEKLSWKTNQGIIEIYPVKDFLKLMYEDRVFLY